MTAKQVFTKCAGIIWKWLGKLFWKFSTHNNTFARHLTPAPMHISREPTPVVSVPDTTAAQQQQAAVLDRLADFLPLLYKAIHSGYEKYSTRHSEHIVDWSKTTRANVIRDYAVGEVERVLAGHPRVRLVTTQRMRLLIIDNRYGIRLKKLIKRRRQSAADLRDLVDSTNIPTKQVGNWRAGTLSLPGLEVPTLTCLDVGYVNNILGSGIDTIWAVARGSSPWYFNMTATYVGQFETNLFHSAEELPAESPFYIKSRPLTSPGDAKQA